MNEIQTETQKLRGRPVTHAEAQASAQRLINSHFRNPDHAHISIPTRAEDDDVTVMDYITEQKAHAESFGIIRVMHLGDGKLLTFLNTPDSSWGVPDFGFAVCDIVRHVAMVFSVHEDAVWEWVDKERAKSHH